MKQPKKKKKGKKRSLNAKCSACGDRPARAHEGLLACRTCARLPSQQFKNFATEMARDHTEDACAS